jgi:hypothetical protein
MRSIWAVFSDSPPYEGAFGRRPDPMPHVTVAKGTNAYLNEVEPLVRERVVARALEVDVREITVSAEGAAPGGKWGVLHRLPLGGGEPRKDGKRAENR